MALATASTASSWPDKAIDLIDEAAASARLRIVDMPDKQKELLEQIKQMDLQIERSIRMEAFSQAPPG